MDIRMVDPSVEVNGRSMMAIIEGFKAFRSVAMKYLTSYGIVTAEAAKKGGIDPNSWYNMQTWLKAQQAMAQEVGENVLFEIGESVTRNAEFPPSIVDIDSAIQSIDVAYHLNHRKAGVVMFDLNRGVMLEGIGHYGYKRIAHERKIIAECDTPYRCKFDQGIVTAMARRFEPRVTVNHDDKKPCRTKGGPSCTYVITW